MRRSGVSDNPRCNPESFVLCWGISVPHARRKNIRFLSADELTRLAEAMRPEYRSMIFLAGVGLRWSEVNRAACGKG
jgi:integrase